MNRYKQALKNVCAELRVSNSDIDILQELVNKATPTKVKQIEDHYLIDTYDYDYTSGHCPCCGACVCCDETNAPNYCSLIVGRNYRGVMNNMKLFKKLFHRCNFNKVAYTSNVIQYDSMGYPLRLYITKCDCGMTNQEWIDVPETSITDKDIVLEWKRL